MAKKKNAAPEQNQTDGPQPKNKLEAVRFALKELGKDAKPSELKPHIQGKYHIEMSTDHISTYKGIILHKGKKKRGRKPAASEPQTTNGAAKHPAAKPRVATSLAEQVAKLKEVAGAIGKE